MSRVRWDVPGTGAGRTRPRVENLALVPASLLPQKATYQRLANQLPAGVVLVVLPTADGPEKQTLQETVRRLRAKGHPVSILPADALRPAPHRRRAASPTPPTIPVSPPPPDPVGVAAPAAVPVVALLSLSPLSGGKDSAVFGALTRRGCETLPSGSVPH